jgi:undecaprenyl-phosphate galactose phosphotransferase
LQNSIDVLDFVSQDRVAPCQTIGKPGALSQTAKRVFDIIASAGLLMVLSPLFLVIAAAIKLEDAGPVAYSHRRVGKNGTLFPCLKFRTMVTDAESRLAEWQNSNPELHEQFLQTFKLKDDPRITPIGRWLRRTSLDELPQLLNVFQGQMSLVGPRPVIIQELEQYYGPVASLYLQVRPGLTGLWQISGRNETGYDERVRLDEWYILNWSFWRDIIILIRTVWVVLSGEGAL